MFLLSLVMPEDSLLPTLVALLMIFNWDLNRGKKTTTLPSQPGLVDMASYLKTTRYLSLTIMPSAPAKQH
jgi:hypothetical protein